MKRPFVVIGAAMFITLFILSYLSVIAVPALIIAGITAVAVSYVFDSSRYALTARTISVIVIIASILFCGKTLLQYEPAVELCDNKQHTVSGTLTDYTEKYNIDYYTINATSIDSVPCDVKIKIRSNYYKSADVDDTITITDATLYKLGMTETSKMNYKSENTYIGAYCKGEFAVTKAENHSINYYLTSIKNTIISRLQHSMNKGWGNLAAAILTGDTSNLSDEVILNFRYAGISHLFAVSGFHLTVWTMFLCLFINEDTKRKKYIKNIISILFVIFFMALTGFTKSVIRAGFMMLVMIISSFSKRRYDSISALFFALTAILFLNPFAATSVSLILSFSASAGMICLSRPLNEPISKIRIRKLPITSKCLRFILETASFSVAATLFTLPATVLCFGYFSLIAPLSNVVVLFPAEMFMVLSGIGCMVSKITFLSKPIFLITSLLGKYITFITGKLSRINYATVNADTTFMIFLFIAISVIFILLVVHFSGNNKIVRRITAGATALIVLLSGISAIYDRNSISLSAVNVGNGTAVLLQYHGKEILIGCGGNDKKDYYITNLLDKINTRTLDLVMLPDSDDYEINCASKILSRYTVSSAIASTEINDRIVLDELPGSTVFTDECSTVLDETLKLLYIKSDSFCGVHIEEKDFTCTVSINPMNDFSTVPEFWQKSDLLISRGNLNEKYLSGFDKIIVISENKTALSENTYSTYDSGTITFTVSPSGKTRVKEQD